MSLSPAENPGLIGHAAIEQSFLEHWQRHTMPHSLLFTGPKGVGKATFAFRLARFVLAGGPESAGGGLFGDEPPADLAISSESPVFRRILGGSHGDFLYLTPDEKAATPTIKVDDIRTIGNFLALTPSESQWRVVIIDAADDMNPSAANALLKVLEEPPSYCMIILISHQPGKLLPTIRSRCRAIAFPPPDASGFAAIVRASLPRIAEIDLQALYVLSHGSAGLALQLEEQDAIGLYHSLMQALGDDASQASEGLEHIQKRLNNPKQKDLWETWRLLWNLWLYRLTLHQQAIEIPFISEADTHTMGSLAGRLSPDAIARIQHQSDGWFADTATLHLDRKQLIQSLFMAVRAGAS